ncbi:MAG: DUF483 domain-containing protein [Deltaproteobacteria bacterium]|nr:DUF483 domain-containing protein [Deltaproteobacteria bacterium]
MLREMDALPPAPHPYRLARIYAELAARARRHDWGTVDASLLHLTGLRPTSGNTARPRVASMLSYRGFKPAELAMLAAGEKPVVKFEDIPLAEADTFFARAEGHYRLIRSAPYAKDGLMLRTHPVGSDEEALVTIYAGRDERVDALAAVERQAPDDARSAGALLGFPPCCVEAFCADMEGSRVDEDTVNDDSCIRILSTAKPGRAVLNPLSNFELLGFYPCSAHCDAATALAERNLAALERQRPGAAARARQRLSGTYLFFRLPFFAKVPNVPADDGTLSLDGMLVNVFPHEPAATIQRRFAALLATAHAGLVTVDLARWADTVAPAAPVADRWAITVASFR